MIEIGNTIRTTDSANITATPTYAEMGAFVGRRGASGIAVNLRTRSRTRGMMDASAVVAKSKANGIGRKKGPKRKIAANVAIVRAARICQLATADWRRLRLERQAARSSCSFVTSSHRPRRLRTFSPGHLTASDCAARHCRHDFYSITSEIVGKCAYPLRRKPCRHWWVVRRKGDSAWTTG